MKDGFCRDCSTMPRGLIAAIVVFLWAVGAYSVTDSLSRSARIDTSFARSDSSVRAAADSMSLARPPTLRETREIYRQRLAADSTGAVVQGLAGVGLRLQIALIDVYLFARDKLMVVFKAGGSFMQRIFGKESKTGNVIRLPLSGRE